MSSIALLFRQHPSRAKEMAVASEYLPVFTQRAAVPDGSLVVGRFSVLPHYRELETDLAIRGSRLINSAYGHEYIANADYLYDVAEHTFPSWFSLAEVPARFRDKPLVVKGRTNSRKFQWDTHMYAPDFQAAVRIGSELMQDPLISEQGLLVRAYVPLETFEVGNQGMPMTNEWRVFFYQKNLLAYGYYWGCLDDWSPVAAAQTEFETNGLPLARQLAETFSEQVDFFVLDLAKTPDGRWLLVEANDGQMSGLNDTIDPNMLYANLAKVLKGESHADAQPG